MTNKEAKEKLLEAAQKFYMIHKDCVINDVPVKEYLEIGLKALEKELNCGRRMAESQETEGDNKKIMPWYLEPFKQAIETYGSNNESEDKNEVDNSI